MSEKTRKPLGLPEKDVAANPKRKPVRGGAPSSRRGATRPVEAPVAEPPKKDWRKPSPKSAAKDVPAGAASRPRPQEKKSELAGVRVAKLMAERGLCSRREADEYIERGWVYVDGQRVLQLGTRVDPSAKITLDKAAVASQQRLMTIILHKPVCYVSGQPEPGCIPAVKLILPENQQTSADTPRFSPAHLRGLAPAGRLDIDSTGLLVLTQDGRVARQLIGENSTIDKEYLVRVEGKLDDEGLRLLNHGLSLDGKKLKPAKVEWLNDDQLRFVLNEGRKRQIRRMCELVGLHVVGLKRVRMGKIRLGNLPMGKWRYLREGEEF